MDNVLCDGVGRSGFRTEDAPCAEAVSLATGAWEQTFTGLVQDSCAAVCPVESKVYFGAAGADSLLAANR